MDNLCDVKPERSPNVLWSIVDGKVWILHLEHAMLHVLENSIGMYIWKSCNGKSAVSDITKRLVSKYATVKNTVEKDAIDFLRDLESKGLILLGRSPSKDDVKVLPFNLVKLVDELKSNGDVIAVFLRGSLARGLATPLSDIDIGIITRSKEGDEARFIGDSQIHLKYYRKDKIEENFEKLDRKAILYLFGSLQDAKILFEKKGYLSSVKQKVLELTPPVEAVNDFIRESWARLVDAWEELIRNDFRNAVLVARLATFNALAAYLIMKRIYNIRQRWEYPNLKKLHRPVNKYTSAFEKIHALDTISKERAIKTVFLAASFIQNIEDSIQS